MENKNKKKMEKAELRVIQFEIRDVIAGSCAGAETDKRANDIGAGDCSTNLLA